jgi:hypothetical protein
MVYFIEIDNQIIHADCLLDMHIDVPDADNLDDGYTDQQCDHAEDDQSEAVFQIHCEHKTVPNPAEQDKCVNEIVYLKTISNLLMR